MKPTSKAPRRAPKREAGTRGRNPAGQLLRDELERPARERAADAVVRDGVVGDGNVARVRVAARVEVLEAVDVRAVARAPARGQLPDAPVGVLPGVRGGQDAQRVREQGAGVGVVEDGSICGVV